MNNLTPYMLFERKQVGILYHFLSGDPEDIFTIMDSDKLKNMGQWGAISFTRNHDFCYEGSYYRFTFDGDKLSDTYKIEPFHFFDDKGVSFKGDECEERIVNDFIPVRKYLLSIDIRDIREDYPGLTEEELEDDIGWFMPHVEEVKKKYSHIIPVNLVSKFRPVKTGIYGRKR